MHGEVNADTPESGPSQAADGPAGDAFAAFARDPLSLFGWARTRAAAPEMDSDDAALRRVRRELGRLVSAPPAGLLAGIDAALMDDDPARALTALQEVGLFAVVLPEVEALIGFHRTCPVHHKDLWDHTLKVVAKMPADVDLRWAALMHDAGKISTRVVDPDGKVVFIRHEAVGAWLMAGVARRLEMPAARAERIGFVIEHHGRVNAYERDWSDRAVGRLMRDGGERLADLLAFSSADFTTKRTAKAARIQENLRHLQGRLARHGEKPEQPVFPRGLGDAVAAALGVVPGPVVGVAMGWLANEVAEGRLAPGQAMDTYIAALRHGYLAEPGER